MKTQYEVRATATEIAVYEMPSGNRYLRMDKQSFANREDCMNCARLIASFLTRMQMWN